MKFTSQTSVSPVGQAGCCEGVPSPVLMKTPTQTRYTFFFFFSLFSPIWEDQDWHVIPFDTQRYTTWLLSSGLLVLCSSVVLCLRHSHFQHPDTQGLNKNYLFLTFWPMISHYFPDFKRAWFLKQSPLWYIKICYWSKVYCNLFLFCACSFSAVF